MCKGFSALETWSYANKQLASQPFPAYSQNASLQSQERGVPFPPSTLQSFKPHLFPPSKAFSIRPVPSLGTDPCWMLPGSMSTDPALPTVYRLGRLFP